MSKPLPSDPIGRARDQWTEHGWPEAAAGMAAITAIMRTQQILLSRIESVLKPYALTFARYELLMLLNFTRSDALPMTKISERLQVHPTSVTSAVNRLETDGLAQRAEHPTDGRATLVKITDRGREKVLAATAKLNELIFENPGFTDDDVRSLNDTLQRFRRNAGDFAEPDTDGS